MKAWRARSSSSGGAASAAPTQALVTRVVRIDDHTAEWFWNVDVLGTPSDGDTINGTLPGAGTSPGSASNSYYWIGDPGDVTIGFAWQINNSEYDGSFAGGLSAPDQAGVVS